MGVKTKFKTKLLQLINFVFNSNVTSEFNFHEYILRNNFSFTYSSFRVPLNATSSCYNAKKYQQSPTWMEIDRKTLSFDSVIVFNSWNLHKIGRCYPSNIPLWKYVYFTSCPVDMMSLNCPAHYVNNDISHIGIFLFIM